MNLTHLQYFIALSEELNFRRAARRLAIEQSPLSQAIIRLEAMLQTQLLERSRQNVQLTATGRAFLPHARAMVRDVSFAHRLAELMRQPRAAIRLGMPTGGLDDLTIRIIRELEKRGTGAPIQLHEVPNADLIHQLQSGELDIAAIARPAHIPQPIESRVIDRRHLIAAIPFAWPQAEKGQLTLADLAAMPLILFPESAEPLCHARLMTIFREAALAPTIYQEAARAATRLELVAAGQGATLIPAGYSRQIPGVSMRVVTDLPLDTQSEVILAWHAQTLHDRSEIFRRIANVIS